MHYASSDQPLLIHADADARSLWLRADQVLPASEPPRAISARNIFWGEIRAIEVEGAKSR